jgi:hypothetical protein
MSRFLLGLSRRARCAAMSSGAGRTLSSLSPNSKGAVEKENLALLRHVHALAQGTTGHVPGFGDRNRATPLVLGFPRRGKAGRANLVVIEATQKARSLDERLAERKPSRYEVHGELKLTGG